MVLPRSRATGPARRWSRAALALAVSIAIGATASGCGVDRTITEPVRAVVQVQAEPCSGTRRASATGVAVTENVVATVAHTFEDVASIRLIGDDGHDRSAEIIWLDSGRDLALLTVDDPLPIWLPLGDSDDGTAVTVVSAASPDPFTAKQATVLQHTKATFGGAGERAALEIGAEIVQGDSGAPVLNTDDEIVGLVFAAARDDDRGWVIAAEEIEAALAQREDSPISFTC